MTGKVMVEDAIQANMEPGCVEMILLLSKLAMTNGHIIAENS
jgi:hypothetical protein